MFLEHHSNHCCTQVKNTQARVCLFLFFWSKGERRKDGRGRAYSITDKGWGGVRAEQQPAEDHTGAKEAMEAETDTRDKNRMGQQGAGLTH